jgi:hypothetical protein
MLKLGATLGSSRFFFGHNVSLTPPAAIKLNSPIIVGSGIRYCRPAGAFSRKKITQPSLSLMHASDESQSPGTALA